MAKSDAYLRDSLTTEALRLVQEAKVHNIPLLIIGSIGVLLRCPLSQNLIIRNCHAPRDIDLVSLSDWRQRVRTFLSGRGYGFAQGGGLSPYMDRDIFFSAEAAQQIKLEVFFDRLNFVHSINFCLDFGKSYPTAMLSTILMSKLQIRKPSTSDLVHVLALLVQWDSEGKSNDLSAVSQRASLDYRCWRDFRKTLDHSNEAIESGVIRVENDEKVRIDRARSKLESILSAVPRTIGWWLGRAKAAVGVEPAEPEDLEISPE